MTERYRCLLADPPWKFGGAWGRANHASRYYRVRSWRDVAAMGPDVRRVAADDAHLYLWSPNALLPQALAVMAAWGFEYKTVITWVKHRSIFGYYFKGQTEQLLFGVRGRLAPADRHQVTVIRAPIVRHSQKPEAQYAAIEAVSPGPRLEMFARARRQNWAAWGDEVESDVEMSMGDGRAGKGTCFVNAATQRAECDACGKSSPIPLPMQALAFSAWLGRFEREHDGCRKKQEEGRCR